MSRKIDVKLPHEMGDYGDWRERFDKPLLHKKITKEDKNMAVIKKEQVVEKVESPKIQVTPDEGREINDAMQVFESIVKETELVLKTAEGYRCLAQVSYQTLGLDKGKPIVDVIYEQLRKEVSQILEVGA